MFGFASWAGQAHGSFVPILKQQQGAGAGAGAGAGGGAGAGAGGGGGEAGVGVLVVMELLSSAHWQALGLPRRLFFGQV